MRQGHSAYAGPRLCTQGEYLCLQLRAVFTPPWALLIQRLFHRLHDPPSWGRCPLQAVLSRWDRQLHTSSRFTSLVHLPREKGYGLVPRTKNGPALAGYGAVAMANALKDAVKMLPARLWRSLTWDRGKELSDHARFTSESGVKVFFAAPRSPWQRGTNENTNGLLRQYFPKGTDLSRWSAQELQAVAHALNTRPRKTLGWKTPIEALNEYLKSSQQPSVATTG